MTNKWRDIKRKKSVSIDKMKELLGLCQKCNQPEAQHVWLSRSEFMLWEPEPGEEKRRCGTRSTEVYMGLDIKVYSPDKSMVPDNPCTVEDMEDIST